MYGKRNQTKSVLSVLKSASSEKNMPLKKRLDYIQDLTKLAGASARKLTVDSSA